MNMKRLIVSSLSLAIGSTLALSAEQGGAAVATPLTVRPMERNIVKGAPYAAEITNESVQTLADGNRIVRKSTGRVYRDSEGRTRREDDRAGTTPSVTISDPIANKSYTLDLAARTARESASGTYLYNSIAPAMATPTAAAGSGGSAASGRAGGGGAGGAMVARGGGGGVMTGGAAGVGVARGGVMAAAPTAAAGGGRGAGNRVTRMDTTEEALPNRVIDGVNAVGVRRTTTIPKDTIGNEQPIKIVSEEWSSPDLKVLLMTDVNDPRTGHSTYTLTRINRGDPDPALFKVPSDFTLQTAGGRGGGGTK